MAYVAPSTVTTLQTYTSAAHNIIVNDIIDHETRIANSEAAWTSFTPTVTSGLTVGNGTWTAKYRTIGKTVFAYYRFVFGSTSAVTGAPVFSLPSTASNGYSLMYGQILYYDSGVARYSGIGELGNAGSLVLQAISTTGNYAVQTALSATVPFTWGTNDEINVAVVYESA